MKNATYIPSLNETLQNDTDGRYMELERRANQSSSQIDKLNSLPKLSCTLANLHEKQFRARLAQLSNPTERLIVLNKQRNLRAGYASAVLLTHEVQSHVKVTFDFMAILLPGKHEGIFGRNNFCDRTRDNFSNPIMANLANFALLHKDHCPDPGETARLLDSVPDLAPGEIQRALRELFDDVCRKGKTEQVIGSNLFYIKLDRTLLRLTELDSAYEQANELWKRYEAAKAAFVSAKAALNEPQFASRLEQAIQASDTEKEQQIKAEHDRARVQFYCAIHACVYFYDQLAEVRARLNKALKATIGGIDAADLNLYTVPKLDELYRDKVRNNCLVASKMIANFDNAAPRPSLSSLDENTKLAVSRLLNSYQSLSDYIGDLMVASLG